MYEHGTPQKSHPKYVESLVSIYKQLPPGDIVELGVAQGRNTVIFGNIIKQKKAKRKYFGFDTFSGYTPEDLKLSPNLVPNQKSGRWDNDPKKLHDILKKNKLDACTIIVGDIKETVPKFAKKCGTIALLYIDCNAYLPAITAARALQNKFRCGTIICADEHRIGGETKALEEFAKENDLYIIETNDSVGIPRYVVYA
jgi:predicted O-methyltransferase YrrM